MRDFDFIEIGTCDFNTLTQRSGDDTVGLAVDAIKEYLEALPFKPQVIKVERIISDTSGFLPVHYVTREHLAELGLPAKWRGGAMVGRLSPTLATLIRKKGHDPDVYTSKRMVRASTFEELIKDVGVKSVKTIKLDIEGHDCLVLNHAIDTIVSLQPRLIVFESNALTPPALVEETIARYAARGFTVCRGKDGTHLKRRS